MLTSCDGFKKYLRILYRQLLKQIKIVQSFLRRRQFYLMICEILLLLEHLNSMCDVNIGSTRCIDIARTQAVDYDQNSFMISQDSEF